jgi:hypothetical protein
VHLLGDEVETVIQNLIDSYYLKRERPRVIGLYRQVALVCRSEDLPVPSYQAVRRRTRAIDPALIGMPGIEKRIARFPQFYSRIGFVHEFRPLDPAQVQEPLEKKWTPPGVHFLTNNSSRRS